MFSACWREATFKEAVRTTSNRKRPTCLDSVGIFDSAFDFHRDAAIDLKEFVCIY